MNVNAISNFSLTNFEGKKSKQNKKDINEMTYPQMDAPMSPKVARMVRNAFLAGVMLAGSMGATSCVDADADAAAAAGPSITQVVNKWMWVIVDGCNKTDTIFQPQPIREVPFHLCDSLIAQGLNIGVDLDGPKPNQGKDVIFFASKAYNENDYTQYQTQIDSLDTTAKRLTLITKATNKENPSNPKVSWIKTDVVDKPEEGIKLTRYVSNSIRKPEDYDWNYAGYEIRTNMQNGTNKVKIYDKNDKLINGREGQYEKATDFGKFLFGTYVYDKETGKPVIDEETGKPEVAHYDFSDAKMWSKEVVFKQVPVTVKGN